MIKDLKGSDYSWSYQTPPSSPSSSSSRKSSMCRYGEVGSLPNLPGNPDPFINPRGLMMLTALGDAHKVHIKASWSPVMWRNWSWCTGMGAGSGLVDLWGRTGAWHVLWVLGTM